MEISHRLHQAATDSAITKLCSLIPQPSAEVEALYRVHDGMDLYVQGSTVGLALYPVSNWGAATKSFRQDAAASGRLVDELYDFEREGIVIGEPPNSGNVIVLYEGRVYYSDHDGGDDTPLAENFASFLQRIVADPPQLLLDLGCYARYSYGRSETQWIPLRYLHD
ncbi:MAG TPA: hypothetical protein VNG73_00220 [Gemmatimonadaceae bacterium]|nr:hypothetical protein [Gemmatimonadaceae bacterium]